jgi:integrase
MADLSTLTSRRRLPRDGGKRWTRLATGRALGYRRSSSEAGTWYVRVHSGGSTYRMASLGVADDVLPADGEEVLNYRQALTLASRWEPDRQKAIEPRGRVATVREVVDRYLDWYEAHRKSYDRIRNIFDAHVLPELGDARVEALTPQRLRSWHQGIAAKPARLRGGQERPARTEDERRARKVTANHALTALKAALNRAVQDGVVPGPGAWATVKPFRGVTTARARYLDSEEIHRLLNASPPTFRRLVAAAIHTGARYGELAALTVGDYRPETPAIHIGRSKTGASRHVFLSDEAVAYFDRLTAGRRAEALLLTKDDGSAWGRNHQYRLMNDACAGAGIEPAVGFHQLRHTYASHYLMSGGSLVAVAKQLGHTTTRMVEQHYGHLADSWRAEDAREHAPSVTAGPARVVRMRRRREAAGS